MIDGQVRVSARDALFFAVAILFTLFTFIDGIERDVARVPLALDTGLGLLSCAALWLRRRWPVAVAVVTGLFGVFSQSASGVALLALFTVAVHRRFAVVAPVVAGFAAASFVSLLVRPDTPTPDGIQVLLGIVCVAAGLAWGMFVRARRQLVESLRERARRAESEQELRVTQARQAERHRIAREMHDVLAHRISLLSLHAGALELRPDAPADEIARAAGVIRDSAHHVLQDLREVIGVLRDDLPGYAPERPQPTLTGLPSLVDESQAAGMRVTLDCRVADLEAVPAAAGRGAYRIVQEGLTNSRKHAPGATVSVSVHGTPGTGLSTEIRNPLLAGSTVIPGTGTGLIGLAERATLAGGRIEHGPTLDGEFRLWAWLPWPT
ncbi:histidine kinase [Nonomuraea muscovyensis]|uniref:histidine kinase n=1 Tax=Nonomuraea muscovyensis TaxID=1124761 RepID=UPI0033E9AFD1